MFLKFLRFKECFWKALFSCSVNGRPNRKDKAAFLIFFCLNDIIIFSTCSKTKLTGQAQSLKKLKKEAEAGLSDFSFATCKPKPCDAASCRSLQFSVICTKRRFSASVIYTTKSIKSYVFSSQNKETINSMQRKWLMTAKITSFSWPFAKVTRK